MPFPFVPLGAAAAALALGGAFTLIYLLVTKLDRAVIDVSGAVVGRLVAGLDDWSHDRASHGAVPTGSPTGAEAADRATTPPPVYEEAAPVPVEPGRRLRS